MSVPVFTAAAAAHRPWPVPSSRWAIAMQWHDLAFFHWPVEPDQLRELVPPGLELDTLEGAAWLGIVPFVMRGVRPRFCPPLPGVSAFPELNVRTYVTAGGKPGVWFMSLDAASKLAVRVARRSFNLPYFDAMMDVRTERHAVRYVSMRTHHGAAEASFSAVYAPTGPVFHAEPDTIEHWLIERYCLYSADRAGRLWRGDVHHAPWPLQPADCEIVCNTMADQLSLDLIEPPPLVHFAKRLDVVAWCPTPVD